MLVAFEGPDNTGKTYGANKISGGQAIYQATKPLYDEALNIARTSKGIAQCFDRVGWISHLAYRLALPNHSWDHLETHPVFVMPETHLVFKIHRRGFEPTEDLEEGYTKGQPARVNQVYSNIAFSLMSMNEGLDYALFKTITIMEVFTSRSGEFHQEIVEYSSPLHPWWGSRHTQLVRDDLSLFDLLMHEEANR